MGTLSLAVSLLSMCRAATYLTTLAPYAGADASVDEQPVVERTYRELKKANASQHVPPILMTRAMCAPIRGGQKAAAADLDVAWDIAERGPMRLHMADIRLHRARLFFRERPYPWHSAEDDLVAAGTIIRDCGYRRRDEELADARRAILGV